MNNLCIPLNIGSNPLIKEVSPFLFPKIRHTRLDHTQVLKGYVKDLLQSLNLEISLLEAFFSQPFFVGNIHIDRLGGDYTKINWVFGGSGSSMHWYSTTQTPLNNLTPLGTRSLLYEEEHCFEIYKHPITSPCLIQAGVPHNIKNQNENRWCVSMCFRDIDTKKSPTMEQSIRLFKDFIL